MANNTISQMLEYDLKYHPMWSAKLDRLVEAARELSNRAERQIYPSDKPNSDYAKLAELTAALRDIELPREAKNV